MRFVNFLLGLILAFATASYAWPGNDYPSLEVRKEGKGNETRSNGASKHHNGNSTRTNSLKQTCKKMRTLQAVSQITANQTKLDSWVAAGKLDTAEVDALKAKAAAATTELQTLQSNTTLVTECATVNAERKSVMQCMQLKQLTKLATLAGNATALAAFGEKKGMNSTQMDKLKEKIANAPTKLKELMSNSTLTTFCTQHQKGKNDDSSSGDSTGSTSTQSQAQQATKNGAASVTAQALPIVALASLFMLFL
ncbi:hypothetical protein E8E13_002429 [Curvularia kusanoi]|uniref:Uncharacterized protein n=1 Tax=Curvularia kusanoi TaxID=90978 RepID=A0A9P4T7E2_CURKU|nr:hypothetical protein E8E13_002429 [Curvularia kusanoi]